jgi:response regulator RpfG family c-di-GMP phosphodiesterase
LKKNDKNTEKLKKHEKLLSTLHAAYRVGTSTVNIKGFCFGILRVIKHGFLASQNSIIITDPSERSIIKAKINKNGKYIFKKGKNSILSQKEKKTLKSGKVFLSKRTIFMPLVFKKTLGLLIIQRDNSMPGFDDTEERFSKTLTETIAVTVKNFQLYDEQHKTIFSTVKALNKFLNCYTSTGNIDLDWVRKVLQDMAVELNLTQEQVISIEQAVLLHDAGKIDIPQTLLNKNTPLTQEEKSLIKLHPRKGVNLLKKVGVLRPVIPIILYHHEKYDGSGYPSGLKKNQIPLEARIMTVIDAFDAMYFGRPYKQKTNFKKTLSELKRNKGTQFDPRIVDIFIKTIQKTEVKKHLKRKNKTV